MRARAFVVVFLAWVPAVAADPGRADVAAARSEPSLAALHRAALRCAGLDGHPQRGWARRSRLAGLMPVLTVRVSRDVARDEGLSRVSSGTERLDIDNDDRLAFEAKAVWQLDRLLFDSVELRADQIAQGRHRQRAQLLARVTELYYRRRKLQLAQRSQQPPANPLQLLAIEELTAQLEALTGDCLGSVRKTGAGGPSTLPAMSLPRCIRSRSDDPGHKNLQSIEPNGK